MGKSAKMQNAPGLKHLGESILSHTKASLEIAALEEESGEEKRGLNDLLPLSSVFNLHVQSPCSFLAL